MSVRTADSRFSFQLPNMSYIDAKWEEPNLCARSNGPNRGRKGGLAAWLSRQVGSFLSWRRDNEAAVELSSMSDRELMDIGLCRADLGRVFEPNLSDDLRQRGIRF